MAGRKFMPAGERFDEKVARVASGCWLFLGMGTHNGYGLFSVGRKTTTAHRFAWERVHGRIPQGLEICHTCDVRRCVNPEHLFAGTRLDNMRDCKAKGRQQKGERHYSVKLDREQVAQIKRRAGTASQSTIALQFGVSQQLVSRVILGKHWSNST